MPHGHDAIPFATHYEQSKDALFTYLMYRLNFNRPLAEDLMMDVVLKAYEYFPSFDPQKGSFKNWIFMICHNHLKNHWRKQAHRSTVSLEALEEEGVTPAVNAMKESLPNDLLRGQLERLLRLMKEEEREVIQLRYLEDLSFEEISAIVGKKVGAVRTQLSRALERFETLLRKLYPTFASYE